MDIPAMAPLYKLGALGPVTGVGIEKTRNFGYRPKLGNF